MLTDYSFTKKSINPNKKLDYGNDDIKKFLMLCNESVNGRKNLEHIMSAKEFYKCEPDVYNRVPPYLRENVFYAYKCRKYTPSIDAKALYLLKLVHENYGSCNFIAEALPKKDLAYLFADETIEQGTCLLDYVRALVDSSFEPLTVYKPIRIGEKYSELYISSTDKVARVDTEIAKMLSYSDVDDIVLQKDKLYLGKRPLAEIGGRFGITRGTYDLRDAL